MNAFIRGWSLRLALVGALAAGGAHAADSSPLGLWKTPRGLVRVYETDGKFFGRIEKSFTPGDDTRRCTACKDDRKDQPVVGLVILRNARYVDGKYEDGEILDATSGSVYHCKFSLDESGSHLVMRGFVGVSLFGKSVTWDRVQ